MLDPTDNIRLFIDLDGVLADFDRGVADLGIDHSPDLNRSRADMSPEQAQAKNALYGRIVGTDFFRNLPLMPGARDLWAAIRGAEPTVLTAVPRFGAPEAFERAARDKYSWVCECLEELPAERFIATTSREKTLFMTSGSERPQVLIDDRAKNIEAWQRAGGIGVLHTEAGHSIREVLKVVGR